MPGLIERTPNSHVRTLKDPVWCRLHALLGRGGERIVADMLIDCALFQQVRGGTGNYYQLSGIPISDLKPEQKRKHVSDEGVEELCSKLTLQIKCEDRTPGTITFVRARMLYAKAALNAKGGVRFGMRHIRQSSTTLESDIDTNASLRCTESIPQSTK